jgi:hypothetical protein
MSKATFRQGDKLKNAKTNTVGQQNTPELSLGKLAGKRTSIAFDDPNVSSDGGSLLLQLQAQRTGLIDDLADAITDQRDPRYVKHLNGELLAQRILQIGNGWEDCNDCDHLKCDPIIKIGAGRDPLGEDLGSQPTMSRLENSVTERDLIAMAYVLVDHFIASYDKAPEMICLDMDPSAHLVYGQQELGLYNTHVEDYCLMPFYVFEGNSGKLITAILRPGKTPTHDEIISVTKRLVRRIRQAWPKVQIVFRADSHHAKPEVMDWLEDHGLLYVMGLSQNQVLNRTCKFVRKEVKRAYQRTLKASRRFHSFYYATKKTWRQQRRVICRALANDSGTDLRYIVTNIKQAGAQYLYETVYSQRGNAELMIKEIKLGLRSDRSSCGSKQANQFRLFLHAAAYALIHDFRERVLAGTELANASIGTIRLRLLKIAARVVRTARTIRVHLPEGFAYKEIFTKAAALLVPVST